jgi:hypothetical protein
VLDDAATDILIGRAGQDWFFAKLTGSIIDITKDRAPAESTFSLG